MDTSPQRAATPDDLTDTGDAALRSIVVCAVPGAGEHVVADVLRRAGAGLPDAYFDTDAVAPRLLEQWEITRLDEYIAALHRHRTSSAGVFGLVLHWHELRQLHRRVAGARQSTPGRLHDIVLAIAPAPTFVRVQRIDRAQHVRELHTRLQGAQAPPPHTGPLSAGDAARIGALLDATDAVWTQWFEAIDVEPLEVVYEQVADDPRAQQDLTDRLALPSAAISAPDDLGSHAVDTTV